MLALHAGFDDDAMLKQRLLHRIGRRPRVVVVRFSTASRWQIQAVVGAPDQGGGKAALT